MQKVKVDSTNCSNCYLTGNSCVILDDLVLNTTQHTIILELASVVSLYVDLTPDIVANIAFDCVRSYQKENNKWVCSIFHLDIIKKKQIAYQLINELKRKLYDIGINPKKIESAISSIKGYYTDIYCIPVEEFMFDCAKAI